MRCVWRLLLPTSASGPLSVCLGGVTFLPLLSLFLPPPKSRATTLQWFEDKDTVVQCWVLLLLVLCSLLLLLLLCSLLKDAAPGKIRTGHERILVARLRRNYGGTKVINETEFKFPRAKASSGPKRPMNNLYVHSLLLSRSASVRSLPAAGVCVVKGHTWR